MKNHWRQWLEEDVEEMLPKKQKIAKKKHQEDDKSAARKPTSIKHQQK
jgi:hypothetical protein